MFSSHLCFRNFFSSLQGALSKAFNYNVSFLVLWFWAYWRYLLVATVWFINSREVTMSSPVLFLCFHSGPGFFCGGLGHSAVFVCSSRRPGEQMGSCLPNRTCCWPLGAAWVRRAWLPSCLFRIQGGSCQRRVLMQSPILKWPGAPVAVLLPSAPVLCPACSGGQPHGWG